MEKLVLDALCYNPGADSTVQQTADAASNGGMVADTARPAIVLAAGAAQGPKVAYPDATSFLGSQGASMLGAAGKAGQLAAAGGITYAYVTGDTQGAFYGAVDYFAYLGLCRFRLGKRDTDSRSWPSNGCCGWDALLHCWRQ